eukprot:TRINITY_DN3839_c0_g1_i3.p1 TRINITY_DN3839_c0_g1~~TRINITY_DN3839_c0_g1_i3.p1  ORF type:complete len:218 (+),score=15.26 TRINITY_DN3839_c0_g1_i3:121-774(+)
MSPADSMCRSSTPRSWSFPVPGYRESMHRAKPSSPRPEQLSPTTYPRPKRSCRSSTHRSWSFPHPGRHGEAACGGLDTWELVKGTPYYNVASAQSMWRNCGNHANCWCGASGGGSGTHGMGCFKCAKGRFLHSRYGKAFGGFASEEIVVVVGDLCPHLGNQKWCPEKAGQRNDYGSLNHLDFSHPPAGIHNNDFVFTPISCPDDLRARYDQLSQCGR